MSEKEYYNEQVLQEHYHKLFDEKIEKEILKPLKADIINTFTGFIGGGVAGCTFTDEDGREVYVYYKVSRKNY